MLLYILLILVYSILLSFPDAMRSTTVGNKTLIGFKSYKTDMVDCISEITGESVAPAKLTLNPNSIYCP